MSDSKQLILIDGSSFLFRAYFAARQSFSTKDGFPTGAVFLITRMFRSLLNDFKNQKVIAVFDAKGPSFRNEMYNEYKATRPPMPDDLRKQIEPVNNLVKALGIPLVSVPGVEADDVLGSYALEAVKLGYKVVICTGDKDLAQLVNDDIELLDTMKNIHFDAAQVYEKYGVPPHLIIDLLALKGDSADNIPGMKGVGDKTASALLNAMGGIYEVKEKIDEVKNLSFRGAASFKERFLEQWDNIELSYKLATIKTDVPLPIGIDELVLPKDNHDALIELFERLEFHRFADEQIKKKESEGLTGTMGSTATGADALKMLENSGQMVIGESSSSCNDDTSNILGPQVLKEDAALSGTSSRRRENIDDYKDIFKVIYSLSELDELKDKLTQAEYFAFEVCTNEVQPSDAIIVGVSLCCSAQEAYYIPLSHNYLMAQEQLKLDDIKKVLGPVFNDEKVKKVSFNSKEARLCLFFNGIEVKGIGADPIIMSHILDSSLKADLRLLSEQYLKYTPLEINDVKDKKSDSIQSLDISTFKDYACQNAHITYRLYEKLKDEIHELADGPRLCELDCQVNEVLYLMERSGAYLDSTELNNQSRTLKSSLHVLERDIYDIAGETFNINSPKQLGRILFENLSIPYPRKSIKMDKDGNPTYSTADDVLSDISYEFEIVGLIQRYRALSKLISTYLDKLPTYISKRTGRIHTVFNLAGTVTGRLSSSDPNLQNIPSRGKEGKQIRTAFTAPQGYKLVSADYSQIELRLIAHFSDDPGLIRAFNSNLDIHRFTASEVLGKSVDEITDDERSHAKATNFGLMYGMSSHGLAKQTGMSSKEAKAYIETYFTRYPRIKSLMESIISEAKETGYTPTLSGFRVMIPGIKSTGVALRAAERAAINAPMQGGAADIIKKAMIEVQRYIDTLEKDAVRLTLQVHDELLFEVREDFVEDFTQKVTSIMENVYTLKVPLKVGIGVGDTWAEAH